MGKCSEDDVLPALRVQLHEIRRSGCGALPPVVGEVAPAQPLSALDFLPLGLEPFRLRSSRGETVSADEPLVDDIKMPLRRQIVNLLGPQMQVPRHFPLLVKMRLSVSVIKVCGCVCRQQPLSRLAWAGLGMVIAISWSVIHSGSCQILRV